MKKPLKFRLNTLWTLKSSLKMRLSLLFLLTLTFSIQAKTTYGQKSKISLDMHLATVEQVIDEIEATTEFKFFFNTRTVDLNRKISIKVKNENIEKVLKILFDEKDISYDIQDRKILLKKNFLKNDIIKDSFKTSSLRIQNQITGSVVDGNGIPLAGANIVEKGTTNGTNADMDGNFTLSLTNENPVLLISYIGFQTKEIVVSNENNFKIVLVESAAGLDEVIVVGYGTQRKSDLTGAVSTINSEEISRVPVVNLSQAMQGRVSGVQVQQNSGELDGNFKILVRGIGTFSGSNDPLYVVDGVPLLNANLSNLNQNNIESLTVLKDASATAIYGARASNGVVLITTKDGGYNQKPLVSFNVQSGFDVVTKYIDVMDSKQFAEFFIASQTNANPSYVPPAELLDQEWLGAPEHNHDFQRMIIRYGQTQDYTVNIAGGGDNVKYSLTTGYLDKKGVLINTDFKRASLGLNLESKLSENLSTGLVFNASRTSNNYALNDFTYGNFHYRQTFQTKPWEPVNDEEIELSKAYTSSLFSGSNPAREMQQEVLNNIANRITGNLNLQWKIIDELTFKTSLGADMIFSNSYEFLPVYDWFYKESTQTEVSNGFGENINWVADQLLTYDKYFNDKHHLTLTGGFSAQQQIVRVGGASGFGGTDNNLDQVGNQPETTGYGSKRFGAGLVSYFGRTFYSFEDKYLFTATLRRDGSSRFGSGNKYGTFPSVALGWRVSEESFLKDNNTLSNLKFRASYGITGNQNIGDFAYLALANTSVASFGNEAYVSNSSRTFSNSNLKWESSKQTSVGVDLSLFKDRVSLTSDYYSILNEDILINVPSPPVSGIAQDPTVNLGSLTNKGFEFSVNSVNVQTSDFTWKTNFNFSINKNKVKDIGEDINGEGKIIFGSLNRGIPATGRDNLWRTQAGYEISSLWGYKRLGIWQLDEADEAATFDRSPGDTKFQDTDGDGKYSDDDMVYIGSPWPTLFGGFTNTFTYKNFTLDSFFNFQQGNKLVNVNRIYLTSGPIGVGNKLAEVYGNWWTPDNPDAEFARPYQGGVGWNNTALSQEYIEDASFLRLKTLSLSYNFPKKLLVPMKVKSASISIIGINLLTFTKYKGQDPEGSSGNREYNAGSANNALTQGMDRQPYPFAKTFLTKLNFTF